MKARDFTSSLQGTGPWTLDSLTQAAVQRERSPARDAWARGLRHFGQAESYLTVVVLLLLAGRWFRRVGLTAAGRRLALSLLLVGTIVTPLKWVVGRRRPGFVASPGAFQPFGGPSSFPSGHTAAATALAGSLALETGPAAGVVLLLGAGGTGWSRMNDNKHWLSDVLAGALLGLLSVGVVHRRDRRRRRAPELPNDGGK